MSSGTKPWGYTIVEVMIFLAVSAALLVSALYIFDGKQQRVEFGQSIRDIDGRIRDVLNDVSTGVYNYTNNFQCVAPPGGGQPVLTTLPGANNQGSNVGCTFTGRVMQFGVSGDRSAYNVFSVVGRQFTGSPLTSNEVQNLAEAHPVAISPTPTCPATCPDATENRQLDYGLKLESITYDNGGGPQSIGAFGFFTNFTSYGAGGSLTSGKQFTDVWPVVPSSLDNSQQAMAQAIISMDTTAASKNPQNGITLCFISASNRQYGKIVIGDDQNRLTTQLTIGEGSSCP